MNLLPETESYLNDVERYVDRKFQYRTEIGFLIESAQHRNMKQVFDDIIFFAKFISHAVTILKRVGPDSADTGKLSNEFRENLEKVSILIRTIVKEAPDEMKQKFILHFFSLSHESMNHLLALLNELSWIKNYSLDQQRS